MIAEGSSDLPAWLGLALSAALALAGVVVFMFKTFRTVDSDNRDDKVIEVLEGRVEDLSRQNADQRRQIDDQGEQLKRAGRVETQLRSQLKDLADRLDEKDEQIRDLRLDLEALRRVVRSTP